MFDHFDRFGINVLSSIFALSSHSLGGDNCRVGHTVIIIAAEEPERTAAHIGIYMYVGNGVSNGFNGGNNNNVYCSAVYRDECFHKIVLCLG